MDQVFCVPDHHLILVKNKKWLLVDDVMTTGATIKDAARALKAAGALEVSALVLARTPK